MNRGGGLYVYEGGSNPYVLWQKGQKLKLFSIRKKSKKKFFRKNGILHCVRVREFRFGDEEKIIKKYGEDFDIHKLKKQEVPGKHEIHLDMIKNKIMIIGPKAKQGWVDINLTSWKEKLEQNRKNSIPHKYRFKKNPISGGNILPLKNENLTPKYNVGCVH